MKQIIFVTAVLFAFSAQASNVTIAEIKKATLENVIVSSTIQGVEKEWSVKCQLLALWNSPDDLFLDPSDRSAPPTQGRSLLPAQMPFPVGGLKYLAEHSCRIMDAEASAPLNVSVFSALRYKGDGTVLVQSISFDYAN